MASTALKPDLVDRTTQAALEEKAKLQKHFGRFDVFFFLICTLVGVDTIGSVASHGAQGFTWLIFLGIFFFLPYAFLTAELGTAIPEEGGPYIWSRMAFGRFVAAINSVIYWIANPIWVGGSLAILSVATFGTFFTPLSGFAKYLFLLVFIWFTVVAAIVSFKNGKWIPTIGAWCRILVLGFFSISVAIYAIKHGVHGFGAGSFEPSYAVFIAAVPVLFFNYVGFELPSAAGEEMKDPQRDVPFAVLRAAVGSVLLYGCPILAILLVLPTSQITSLGGFIDAIKQVFTVYGGHVSVAKDGSVTATLTGAGQAFGWIGAGAFIFALLTSGTTWIMGSDRTLAVASFDGAGPRLLGRFSARFGTPLYVNILSGIMATITMVLADHFSGGNANKYFTTVLNLAISTTTISYLAIFPALVKLRLDRPDLPRPYKVPFGMAGVWTCSVLTELWALFATIVLIWPGFGVDWFGGKGHPNDLLAAGFTRGEYEITQIIPLLVLFALGVLFYILGAPTREQMADVPLVAEESAVSPSPA